MKDYKTGAIKSQVRSHRSWLIFLSSFGLILISAWLILTLNSKQPNNSHSNTVPQAKISTVQQESTAAYIAAPAQIVEPISVEEITILPELSDSEIAVVEEQVPEIIEQQADASWKNVTVKSGDSLALIFSRLGLSPGALYNIMSLGKEVARLKKLQPGQTLNFRIEENELTGLKYEIDLTRTLKITKQDNKFLSELMHEELESVVKDASAIIKDSLFLSGKKAGLSDNLIMQLVSIYGWDIDFALDIREGDSFSVIYEEQFKDGVKVADGPIIAAEFVNRNTPLRAVRYTHDDGRIDYYAENGDAMRKAFLRTPVNFTRISSRFNLKRKHPILNRIRAHKGVDYAASTGTPIKATGDGTVAYAGKKGGYGRTIILKHGGKYSTVYAHLHRYARGVRTGKRVKQGQIIGYVGKSGLATGPHLHYEFRLNGVHRNPLTIKLPKVESINKKALPEFRKKITPMIAELDRLTGTGNSVLAAQQSNISSNQSQSKPMMEDG
jgi:murein DD-endopeptidase MepM/ murein hydrolase activator NlpD